MAEILRGDRDQRRHVRRSDGARPGQPGQPRGDAQRRLQSRQPVDEGRRRGFLAHRGGAGHAGDAGELGHLRRRRGQVEAHHVVDHHPVGETVVEVGDGRQRVRARMDGAEVLLESDRPHHRTHQHVGARGEVGAVAHRDGQRARGDPHAFQRDAVAQRVVRRRQVALDVVRQRVHAGRGGDRRRQAERQLRVGEHRAGQDLRREHDALDVRVVLGDHGGAPDLRAGAGGRRQRDEVRQVVADRAHVRVVPDELQRVAVVRAQHADDLRHVERGAAAEADDAVGRVRTERRAAGVGLRDRRVAVHAVVHGDVETRGLERRDEAGGHGQPGQRAVGDDQRPPLAELGQVRADGPGGAGAEMDGGGKAEAVDGHRESGEVGGRDGSGVR